MRAPENPREIDVLAGPSPERAIHSKDLNLVMLELERLTLEDLPADQQ